MNRKRINRLSLLFFFIFLLTGSLIIRSLQNEHPLSQIIKGEDIFTQSWTGILFGIIAGSIASGIVTLPFLKGSMDFFKRMLVPLKLRYRDIFFLSFCAGFGEEFLFRAAIQPLIGIWITAFIFVLLHGYLNPKNLQLTVYGIYMVIVVGGLGYLFREFGYLSASLAHFFIDVVLLVYLLKVKKVTA